MGVFGRMTRATAESSARSSTASHVSKDYETFGVGTAATQFEGLPLWNSLQESSTEDLVYLGLLVTLLLLRRRITRHNAALTMAYWGVVLAGTWALKEITLYPLLTNIIYTRTSYPYMVVFPHCLTAAAAYRTERSDEHNLHYLPTFALGFFCYGFGGSILSDLLMGLPVTALAHARIVPCWVLAYFLVWFSPNDIVYRLCFDDNSSFAYYFMTAWEAVDAVTTPMGRVSRSARELQNKTVAPIMAGVFAGAGGAAIRYTERVGLRNGGEQVATASRKAIEDGAWRNLCYSLLWWYLAVYQCDNGAYDDDGKFKENNCHEYNGHDRIRVTIVLTHVTWALLCTTGVTSGHPLVWLCRQGRAVGATMVDTLNWGPPPKRDIQHAKTD